MKNIIFAILLPLSFQVFARGGADRDFKLLDELDLSSEQLEKIKEFKLENNKNKEVKKEERGKHKEAMKKLFIEGAPDSTLRKLHDSIVEHRSSHADRKLEKMIFLKNLLDKNQRETYIEKKKDHREKNKKRKHGND